MIRVRTSNQAAPVAEGGLEIIPVFLQRSVHEKYWFDIESSDSNFIKAALEAFNCHHLAVNEALRERLPPKIEFFSEHTFMVYRGIVANTDDLIFEHQQLIFLVTDNYLVSLHRETSIGINLLLQEGRSSRLIQNPIGLACRIMYLSSSAYTDELLQFETKLAELEDQLLNAGSDSVLAQLTLYKSRLIKLLRTFTYHMNITETLIEHQKNEEDIEITYESEHVLHTLNERFHRLHSLARMQYEIIGDLMNGYLSITSHQMNNTMKVLTVITAVFVPLGFLTGLYGMNFEHIPELHARNGYFILLGVMTLITIGLLWLFRRYKWI